MRSPEFFADAYLQTPTVFELEHYGTVKKLGNWDGRPDSPVAKFGKGKKGPDYFRGALELAARHLHRLPRLRARMAGRQSGAHRRTAQPLRLLVLPPSREPAPGAPAGKRGSGRDAVGESRRGAGVPAVSSAAATGRPEGFKAAEQEFEAGNRRWLPVAKETFTERYRFKLPGNLKAGPYILKFKLHSADAARDVLVALRGELRDPAGFYRVGTVEVQP